MKKLLILSLLIVASCINQHEVKESNYKIIEPTNGNYHAIIKIKNSNRGLCSAFVVSDTLAITASHCTKMNKSFYDKGRLEEIKKLQEDINKAASLMQQFKQSCIINCEYVLAELRKVTNPLHERLKYCLETKVDEMTIYDIHGKDTKIIAIAESASSSRDYAFLKGDFKKFNKLKLKQGWDARPKDIFKVCGFPGSKNPAVCVDYIALGSDKFRYIGESMFQPGISGSPVIDYSGQVIGIASSVKGDLSVIEPTLGIIDLE